MLFRLYFYEMEALDNYSLTIHAELPSPLQKVGLGGSLRPCCVQEPATSLAHLPMGTLGLKLPQGPRSPAAPMGVPGLQSPGN